MARPNKGNTRRITLRSTDVEHAIIRQTQQHLEQSGVRLSENDTINFLIQCAAVPPPLTTAAARHAVEMHWKTCTDCTPDTGPQCAAGVYLRDCYQRAAAATPARPAEATQQPPAPPRVPIDRQTLANHLRTLG